MQKGNLPEFPSVSEQSLKASSHNLRVRDVGIHPVSFNILYVTKLILYLQPRHSLWVKPQGARKTEAATISPGVYVVRWLQSYSYTR